MKNDNFSTMGKQQVLAMLNTGMGDNLNVNSNANYQVGKAKDLTAWGFWRDHYYPEIIRESYPVYIRDRAEDKGKQAFEIIKQLQDMKLIKLNKVSDFIDAMDALIKIL